MSELSSEQRQAIIAAVQGGRKIEAVKLYRDATSASLADSKHFIESLQDTLATGEVPAVAPEVTDTAIKNRVIELLRSDQRILAIKEYCESTGVRLKEGKAAVEAIASEQGIETPNGAGCSIGSAAILLAISFVVYALA